MSINNMDNIEIWHTGEVLNTLTEMYVILTETKHMVRGELLHHGDASAKQADFNITKGGSE